MAADSQSALVHEMLSHLKVKCVDYDSRSQVANFYANRSVFITGATGFIGKVIKKVNEIGSVCVCTDIALPLSHCCNTALSSERYLLT